MVRKVAQTKEERNAARQAVQDLHDDVKEAFGEAHVKTRTYIGDEYGDAGMYFRLDSSGARQDAEHSKVAISDLMPFINDHGFSLGDAEMSAELVREREKDFVHEPDVKYVFRVTVYYEYPEADL